MIVRKIIGAVGQKCGMTHFYHPDTNILTPTTIIRVLPNRIVQFKVPEKDGYFAVQVTTGVAKQSRLNKPLKGHFAKANVEPGKGLWEFRIEDPEQFDGLKLGHQLTVEQFTDIPYVDICHVLSIGKGNVGTAKKDHFSLQGATHGNSLSHRVPGSIGQRQSPGKVFKNKKMPGHLGNKRRTQLSLKVFKIDVERHLILVKGSIPGAISQFVLIRSAIKKKTTIHKDKN